LATTVRDQVEPNGGLEEEEKICWKFSITDGTTLVLNNVNVNAEHRLRKCAKTCLFMSLTEQDCIRAMPYFVVIATICGRDNL